MQPQKTLKSYGLTRFGCYLCFIIQAIIINFPPVLFLSFSERYNIPLSRITLLVIINFAMQFIMDLLSALLSSRLNYRAMAISANIFSASGLILLGILPDMLSEPYAGLVLATLVSAIGGGLIEVIGNPIMQSCPEEGRSPSLGFLHSFYCWGHLGVVLVSTLFILIFGDGSRTIMSFAWAAVPALNVLLFAFAPIDQPSRELERTSSIASLAKTRVFWVFILIMILAGACEQGMAQWASAFAETALTKTGFSHKSAKLVGDLIGPCIFALTMALSRMIYPAICKKFDLAKTMILSSLLCVCCYLTSALSSDPFVSLIGCGICGFSVGIMWPGTLDLTVKSCAFVGTAFFAMLSLAGDIGCAAGPALVGFAADAAGGDIKAGILLGALLPLLLVIMLTVFRMLGRKKS